MYYNISYDTVGDLGQRMWVCGLYAYPAIPGRVTIPAPDLAAGPPRVSNGGTTYTITIRSGARWDTSPFSPVTAEDAVLGLKRSCNPAEPFGGLPDFISLIKGMATFCAGFAKVAKTVPAFKSYIDTHSISGVTGSGQAITFTLTHPASYFADILALSPFNPAPPQSLNWVPGSAAAQQHTFADGPYKCRATCRPGRSFVRNGLERLDGPDRGSNSTTFTSPKLLTRPPPSRFFRPSRPRARWNATVGRPSQRFPGWSPRCGAEALTSVWARPIHRAH
jgi:ABC-type transport system substrate-binding protein